MQKCRLKCWKQAECYPLPAIKACQVVKAVTRIKNNKLKFPQPWVKNDVSFDGKEKGINQGLANFKGLSNDSVACFNEIKTSWSGNN